MTKGNHKEWCELMTADMQTRGYLEVCNFGPMHEKSLAAIEMQLLAENKLANDDQMAARQIEAKANISHKNGHAFMITALGTENGGLHLDPNTKTGVQLYAAIHALFGVTDPVNKRSAEAAFRKQAATGTHVYEEDKTTAGPQVGECHRLWLAATATGSRTTERQAFDEIVNGMSILLYHEKRKWQVELDGMPPDANVLPEGSWERLKLAFEREETHVHDTRAAKRAEKAARGGGTALATKADSAVIEKLQKEVKELKALATVSKSSAGGGDCYKFKATGKCDFGDRCRFSHDHAGGGGGRGGGGRSKQKAGGACFQFRKKGSCKFGDSCRFSHADGSADGEQDSD
jgi:hypothetical protein